MAVGLFMIYKSQRKFAGICIIGFFVGSVFLFAPQSYWEDASSIVTENVQAGTGQERVESWKAGWRMFLDYPLLGVGVANYPA